MWFLFKGLKRCLKSAFFYRIANGQNLFIGKNTSNDPRLVEVLGQSILCQKKESISNFIYILKLFSKYHSHKIFV